MYFHGCSPRRDILNPRTEQIPYTAKFMRQLLLVSFLHGRFKGNAMAISCTISVAVAVAYRDGGG